MITFHNNEFLLFLILLLPMLYFIKRRGGDLEGIFSKEVLEKIKIKNRSISKRVRNIFLILSLAFIIISLSRPQIDNGVIKIKSTFINMVTAIDMSKSMFANDVYPNRFEFAKKKFFDSLSYFKNMKIALIGFSTQTFLISPLTEDFYSLRFLAKNLSLDYLSLEGTDIMMALQSADELFGNEKRKILFLFTDGGDKISFEEEISFAKEHNIIVYIYNIGTDRGGIIKDKDGVLKDKNGDIVVVKRTDNIKKLAIETGGAYMRYSLAKEDIKSLVNTIQNRYKAKNEKDSTIKDRKELFYFPLILAILFLFISLFSLPRKYKLKGKK